MIDNKRNYRLVTYTDEQTANLIGRIASLLNRSIASIINEAMHEYLQRHYFDLLKKSQLIS